MSVKPTLSLCKIFFPIAFQTISSLYNMYMQNPCDWPNVKSYGKVLDIVWVADLLYLTFLFKFSYS